MKQLFRSALESSSAHGLPRTVSSEKPLFVRLIWLALFSFMLVLFLNSLVRFTEKLIANPQTSSIEANSVTFQFPDIYACHETPVSASYAVNVDKKMALEINSLLSNTTRKIRQFFTTRNQSGRDENIRPVTFAYVHSLPYSLLVDALAHRAEQSVISSGVLYRGKRSTPQYKHIEATSFFHPTYLRCSKWTLDKDWQKTVLKSGSWAGITATLLIDSSASEIESNGAPIQRMVYSNHSLLSVWEWSLSMRDIFEPDRSAGIRVFLAPQGEYPSEFVSSFVLGPGKHHTVEIEMLQQEYTAGQFSCRGDSPAVQFVNPYDDTPYNHTYSYSYCFYKSYHEIIQRLYNLSGDIGPLPWPLRGKKYVFNLTGEPNFASLKLNHSDYSTIEDAIANVEENCQLDRPCSSLQYRSSVSSADWPIDSSIFSFINSTVREAWTQANARNLSVPALDFLMTGNDSVVSSYVRKNLLKVHFKPSQTLSDKIVFSRDYGLENFVAEIGGTMGIYLGMSLLTLCELFELIYNIVAIYKSKKSQQQVEN